MSFSMINFIILVLFCIASSSTTGAAHRPTPDIIPTNHHDILSTSLPSLSLRNLQNRNSDKTGPDGSCHLSVSTIPIEDTISSHGIIFAIKSDDANDDSLMITSFGFHVDRSYVENGGKIGYEVYVLKEEGYYANPERDPDNPSVISVSTAIDPTFDYRGKIAEWDLIAEGQISANNLTKGVTTLNETRADFFQIPFGVFSTSVSVPANGGLRSFYIATKSNSFIYSNPTKALNEEMSLIPADGVYAPKILEGEGVVSYPMPESSFLYQPKSFVGKVYYEKECPSPAPSISAQPSSQPAAPSQNPSVQPSNQPSEQPSLVSSEMPSFVPSSPPTINTEKVSGGLLVQMVMDCKPGEVFPVEESANIAATVQKIAADEANLQVPPIFNVNATVVATFCVAAQQRQLITNPAHTEAGFNHRHLPASSSALDFSVIITGEYRPPCRPGEWCPAWTPPDIGTITEASINRDPENFVKDLKKRAGTSSQFVEVEVSDLELQSFEVEVGETPKRYTMPPAPMPTLPPTTLKEDNIDSILKICIIITSGIIVLLGAFLLFRHGERRAAKLRREKMARLEQEKAMRRWDKQRKVEWEEANKHMHAPTTDSMAKGSAHYGNQMVYGYPPPPPPNYYAGGAHPHNYNYSYGGPPPPAPPHGKHYADPNSQGYPYPPPPPPPHMQGPNYGQPPNNEKV